MKKQTTILALMATSLISSLSAEWHFGVGTGIAGLAVDGDIGLTSNGGTPLDSSVDLDPNDVMDLMGAAGGLSGYAKNGNWTFFGGFNYLELEGDGSGRFGSIDLEFDMLSVDAMVGYTFYDNNGFTISGHGGLRYTSHDLSSEITRNLPILNSEKSIDESWVDVILGISADWRFTEKWAWRNRIDYGFGGSEGMFFAQTGLDWMFHEHWSTGIFANIRKVDFEDGNTGDLDYYSYEVDEVSFGISIVYHW